jgi:16S rRNA (guanine527-N7)-methyltransferase
VTAKLGPLVDGALASLGSPGDAGARDAIVTWVERLREWNTRMDLTAARSDAELVDLMLGDAAVLAAHVAPGARVVDVGTGAGAPGLGLALLRPDLGITLVEPRAKRAAFLRTAVGLLERTDVRIDVTRGETLPAASWDVAISRATLEPQAWLDLGARLVASGGRVWALLAQGTPPVHPRARTEHDLAYSWPLTGAPRRAVEYRLDPGP